MQQGALRLIEAEAVRDAAERQVAGLREAVSAAGLELHREQQRSAEERERLHMRWAVERQRIVAEWTERLAGAERERAALDSQLVQARRDAMAKDMRIAELEGTLAALRDEVEKLRKGLAKENSAKVLGAVLSGIAGMVGGAVMAKQFGESGTSDIQDIE
jgi:flagellar motility protein MotE (MotC chaperone)